MITSNNLLGATPLKKEGAPSLSINKPIGNPYQQKAISHGSGPCLVLAGPGSGKTFVLVQHILYLIRAYHVPPAHILVLTFSKAAAAQMQSRFYKTYSEQTHGNSPTNIDPSAVVFGTFHSVFFHILKLSHTNSDKANSISVIPTKTKYGLLKNLCQQYLSNEFDEIRDNRELDLLAGELSRQKQRKMFPGNVATNGSRHECSQREDNSISLFPHPKEFPAISRDYHRFLDENNLIDFDDMIFRCRELFMSSPEILQKWQSRFQYILIDEFQDISPCQLDIVRLLAGGQANIFAVGDDDQSIYAFRGADPSVMRTYLSLYPGATQINLEMNYRCSERILEKAALVIRENKNRLPKHIVANKKGGRPIEMQCLIDAQDQYQFVCEKIKAKIASGITPSDIAVIVRTNIQISGWEQALTDFDLPIAKKDPSRKYIAPVTKRVLSLLASYYQCAYEWKTKGEMSRAAFFHIMNVPQRYLLRSYFSSERVNANDLAEYPNGPSKDLLIDLMEDLRLLVGAAPSRTFSYLCRQVGVYDAVTSELSNEQKRQVDDLLRALSDCAGKCRDSVSFLHILRSDLSEILSSSVKKSEESTVKDHPGISILTMHACKGLEFTSVILPDLNEGIIPTRKAETPAAIEEERRLLYVAMTRAKDDLLLCTITGTKESPRRPSRFLLPLGVKPPWE